MLTIAKLILITSIAGGAACAGNISLKNSQDMLIPEMEKTIKDNCLPGCPRIHDPICAVDEKNPKAYKYFHNKCLMGYDNCRQSLAWKPTQMLLCINDVEPTVRAGCMRACPLIYDPLCATNGKNYEIFGNQCSFGMENCLASGKWLEVPAEQCGL